MYYRLNLTALSTYIFCNILAFFHNNRSTWMTRYYFRRWKQIKAFSRYKWNDIAPPIGRIFSSLFSSVFKNVRPHVQQEYRSYHQRVVYYRHLFNNLYSSFSFLTSLIALSKSCPLSAASNLWKEWRKTRIIRCWRKRRGKWNRARKASNYFEKICNLERNNNF